MSMVIPTIIVFGMVVFQWISIVLPAIVVFRDGCISVRLWISIVLPTIVVIWIVLCQ